jgi:uncharacterized protein
MIMTDKKSSVSESKCSNAVVIPADPAPLGLVGLGVAALVLAAMYLGLVDIAMRSLLVPWVLFFGATAQLIAGTIEFKRNNIFGGTVFTTYAMAMYAIGLTASIISFTEVGFDILYYGFGLIAILIFTLIATMCSIMTNKMFVSILVFVDIALISLIAHYFFGSSAFLAGVFLLLTSLASFYTAAAVLFNIMAGKQVFPLGKALWKP